MTRALVLLLLAALAAEAALLLVGGPATAAVGAGVLVAAGLVTARYVTGFASQDTGRHETLRMLETRRPGLGDWQKVVEAGLTGRDEPAGLLVERLRRLYAVRLAERHAVSLHGQPERAATLVAPEVWALIAPGATPVLPVPEAVLRAAVEGLRTL